MRRLGFGIGVLAMLGPVMPVHAKDQTKPVIVGKEAELNACTSIGHVEALGAQIDLGVRAAPSVSARETERLGQGHIIWICQQLNVRGKSGWFGIVYGPAEQSHGEDGVPPSCGVDEPIAKPRAYRGPCKSGWVPAARITMDAG